MLIRWVDMMSDEQTDGERQFSLLSVVSLHVLQFQFLVDVFIVLYHRGPCAISWVTLIVYTSDCLIKCVIQQMYTVCFFITGELAVWEPSVPSERWWAVCIWVDDRQLRGTKVKRLSRWSVWHSSAGRSDWLQWQLHRSAAAAGLNTYATREHSGSSHLCEAK